MSFEDLEAGTRRPPPLPLAQVVAHAVFGVPDQDQGGALRHLGDALGTPKDTPALRSRLRGTRAEATRLAKITSQKLSQAAETAADSADATKSTDSDSKSKLAMDFEAALRDFQQVLHRIVAAERPIVSAAAAAAPAAGGGGAFAGETQQQLLATGIENHEAVLMERELGMLEAQHAITEIDDMLRNLATLVNDQDGGVHVHHVICDIEMIAAEEEVSEKMENPATTRSSETCLLVFAIGLFLFIFVLVLYR